MPVNTPETVICFGESLLRLNAPGHELLLQSRALNVHFGGAESNVAVALARFGHDARMVSVLPDNALGHACRAELRMHGVNVSGIRFAPGRMGLYFMANGGVQRAADVLYDRAGSAFAQAPADLVDWDEALAGSAWLHVSGITPALGHQAARATVNAVRAARRLGVAVSFDCNYRAKLWSSRGADPAQGLREVAEQADLLFADDRALSLMLGRGFDGESVTERFRSASDAALAAFPHLRCVTATSRIHHSADHHELSALMNAGGRLLITDRHALDGIVDRIGAGDAFAAGILHGRIAALGDGETLDFALATACLKHSIPGDRCLFGVHEIEDAIANHGRDVRR